MVRAVIDGVCRASAGDTSALGDVAALYADPTFVLHPMHPEIPPLRTQADFLRHFTALRAGTTARPVSREAVDVRVHATADPEIVVTEFRYRTVIDGATLETPCIWVTRVHDGRITEARDYNGQPAPVSR